MEQPMESKPKKLTERLTIIWTIALKDILDGLKNKVVLSLVLGVLFMLLMPSFMAWMIEPPFAKVFVHDPGGSQLVNLIEEDDAFRVQRVPLVEDFENAVSELSSGMGIEYGLLVPAGFDETLARDGEAVVEVYVPWSFRTKIPQLKEQIEEQFSSLSGGTVRAEFDGNIVYPSPQSNFTLGLSTQLPVLIVLLVGTTVMPYLFFEEKQTKTMDALLISPASEGQIVAGKALVGMFYILVACVVAFGLNWSRVVHWEMVLLFVVCGGLFGVGVGLVFGTFFSRQQEIFGVSILVFLLLLAAIFVQMIEVDLSGFIRTILPRIPSVALAEMIQSSYLQHYDWGSVLINAGSVLAISFVLYALVVWRLRRSDR
jgi:ABC-2 type transport system permease protein